MPIIFDIVEEGGECPSLAGRLTENLGSPGIIKNAMDTTGASAPVIQQYSGTEIAGYITETQENELEGLICPTLNEQLTLTTNEGIKTALDETFKSEPVIQQYSGTEIAGYITETQEEELQGIICPVPPVYEAEAVALFEKLHGGLSDSLKSNINDYIFYLKQAGIWANLDVLGFVVADNFWDASINWVNPSGQKFTLVGFDLPNGYIGNDYQEGDGSTMYIDTNFEYDVSGKFQSSNASFGFYSGKTQTNGNVAMGMAFDELSNTYINPKDLGGQAILALNKGGSFTITPPTSDTIGFYVATNEYDGSDTYQSLYKNTVLLGTQLYTPEPVHTGRTFKVLYTEDGGHSDISVGMFFIGSALSEAQIIAMNGITATLITELQLA